MSSKQTEHGDNLAVSSNCFKVVLIGDARVGKTCLTKALKHDSDSWELPRNYKPTNGAWVTYFDVSDACRLLIYDTSGRQEFKSLVQHYLKLLHCVVFVFALDDPSSFERLHYWHELFKQEFTGDPTKVCKFVIGTKLDLARFNTELQTKATSFAEASGAEVWVTSAATAFNAHELFVRISEHTIEMLHGSLSWVVPQHAYYHGNTGEERSTFLLDDSTLGKAVMVRYPDPILLDTDKVPISNIVMCYHCVVMSDEDGKTFKWGTWCNRSFQEAKLEECPFHKKTNALWSCVMSQAPPSTWQHENLSGEMVLGTMVRRQPTKTGLRDFKKLFFSSRNLSGKEEPNRFFYTLLLTEEESLFECGLDRSLNINNMVAKPSEQHTLIQNHFHLQPKQLQLPIDGEVTCVSVSETHAGIIVGSDKTVMTWGSGQDGALGLEEHLVTNFNPPSPLPVTSLNCKVNQVACGIAFTLMLTAEGQVYSCGSGEMGKLGHGDETNRMLPTLIKDLTYIKAIAAGNEHALALTEKGSVYHWGLDCGDESLARFTATPTRVQQLDNVAVKAISCGMHHSVCLANGIWYSGIPYTWGRGSHGRLGLGNLRGLFTPRFVPEFYDKVVTVVQVSAARKHTGFLTKAGDVYTCGNNDFGQLGYFTASGYSDIPVKVDLSGSLAADERATEICCHEDYTMIATERGNVVLWGKCFYGPKIDEPVPINRADAGKMADSITGVGDIVDVTTCHLLCNDPEKSTIELILALTRRSHMMLCAGITADCDSQAIFDSNPLIACNKPDLAALSSVGPVLVALDSRGRCYFTNISDWIKSLLGDTSKSCDLVHTLFSSLKQIQATKVPNVQFKPIDSLPGHVTAVETTLSSFLFSTDIGDVYSWSPFSGGRLFHHRELNGEIVTQIACGSSHFAALTDEGLLFTCGSGLSGQLGHGTFDKNVEKFQLVSLTRVQRVQTVCCGWTSTVVLTLDGRVFFWGQLDLPRGEKRRRRFLSLATRGRTSEFVQENQVQQRPPSPVTYKVEFVENRLVTDKHLTIVGKPFVFEIVPRDMNVVRSSCIEFRVEAVRIPDSLQVNFKGKIKQCQKSNGSYRASIDFHSEGVYKVSVTRNGDNILGSPFRVHVENGTRVSRMKVSLIGCDIECVRAVGGVLQQVINANDLGIELWGIPSITTDLPTFEAYILASMTDGGMFVYVWDASCSILSEQNLSYWLHLLKMRAPSSEVIILGMNCSSSYANELDLRPLQKANPRVTRAIFAGTSDLAGVLEEVHWVGHDTEWHQNLVWHRFACLASKVEQMKKGGVEIIDEHRLKCLAGECGIHGDAICKEAFDFLQFLGLGLVIGRDHPFLMIHPNWLLRHLTEMSRSSHHGILDLCTIDSPMQQEIAELLIEKGVAMRRRDGSTMDIVPFLCAIPLENWPSIAASQYTVYRHLVLSRPPFHLHSIFLNLASNIVRLYDVIALGKFTIVVHAERYDARVDVGPCAINKSLSEIRITVRATTQDYCTAAVEPIMAQLHRFLVRFLLLDEFVVKLSCNGCRRQYFDLSEVQRMADEGTIHLKCTKCGDSKVNVSELLSGFKETRPPQELQWSPLCQTPKQGRAQLGPDTPSSQYLLRPLMRYFGDREERQARRIQQEIQEIKEMIRNMAKVFADTKFYTTPRTVCLLPEFQKSSILKSDAVRMLLTWGKPKYRLFLLCEGNGDGTGVHFLDTKKHKGYLLETCVAAGLISNAVELLRFALQILITSSVGITAIRALGYLNIEEWEMLNNLLGTTGLSGAILSKVPWKSHFKEMDKFLKDFQETAKSIPQPKELSTLSSPYVGYQVSSESYNHLRDLLTKLGSKDNFGGLRQEPREGVGAIWVCEKHSIHNRSNSPIKVMP